jgi:hypothetical protein
MGIKDMVVANVQVKGYKGRQAFTDEFATTRQIYNCRPQQKDKEGRPLVKYVGKSGIAHPYIGQSLGHPHTHTPYYTLLRNIVKGIIDWKNI